MHLDAGRLKSDSRNGEVMNAGGQSESGYTIRVGSRLPAVGPNLSVGKRGSGLAPHGCYHRTGVQWALSAEKRGCAGDGEERQGRASHPYLSPFTG